MIPRINSGDVQGPGLNDPMAAQRAVAQVNSDVSQVTSELQRLGGRVEADLDRGADAFSRVEATRRANELDEALDRVMQEVPEGGAGFEERMNAEVLRVQSESRARAGDDTRRITRLDGDFAIEAERYKGAFAQGERDQLKTYVQSQHLINLDNAKQRAARAGYVDPADFTPPDTLQLIRDKEGFRTGAYWDVNAWRVGYGSDTVTRADGTIVKVTKSTKVTREDAERDLARRAAEFSEGVRDNIGAEKYDALPAHQKAVLGSIAYNYGSLPGRVSKVIAAGGDVGAAIRGLGGDNGGTNEARRNREAHLWETGTPAGRNEYGAPIYDGEVPDLGANEDFQDELALLRAEIEAMPISRAERAALARQAEAELTSAALGQIADENPQAALALLESGALDDALSFDQTQPMQRQLLRQQLSAQSKAQEGAAKEEARRIAQDRLAEFDAGGDGSENPISPQQVALLPNGMRDALEAAPHVSVARMLASEGEPGELVAMRDAIAGSGKRQSVINAELAAFDRIAEGRVREHEAGLSVDAAVSLNMPPNMGNEDQREVVDGRFAAAIAGAEPGTEFAALTRFVSGYGVVPKMAQQMIAQALGAEDPNVQAMAVEAVGRIQAENPRALVGDGVSPAVKRAIAAEKWVSLGVPLKDALKHSEAALDPLAQPGRDARQSLWIADKRDLEATALEALQDSIGRSAKAQGGRVAMPDSVMGEYLELVREQYLTHGQMDVAVTMAHNAFLSTHAISEVGGVRRWMNGAPEAVPAYQIYASDAENSAWVEQQAMLHGISTFGSDFSDLQLLPVQYANRRERPSYRVVATDADGVRRMAPDLFTPNPSLERAFAGAEQFAPAVQVKAEKLAGENLRISEQRSARDAAFGRWQQSAVIGSPDEVDAAFREYLEASKRLTEMQAEVAPKIEELQDLLEPERPRPAPMSSPFQPGLLRSTSQ